MPPPPPEAAEPLLTTAEVAELLSVHPKRVYRLVREGMPGRRLGGEWRFVRPEVLAWVRRAGAVEGAAAPGDVPGLDGRPGAPAGEPDDLEPRAAGATGRAPWNAGQAAAGPPPLLGANGDVAIELLLALLNRPRPVLGFVQADRDQAQRLLEVGALLAAGSHGKGPPARLGAVRLARVHLVEREVGLVAAPGKRVPRLHDLPRLRFASRPPSAGVYGHLDRAAREAHLDVTRLLARARPLDSHREVALAVLRGEADAGICTAAWAARTGLPFRVLAEESYGLLVRAADLGDPRVVRLCEVAQGSPYRELLAAVPGYRADEAGTIRYDPDAG